MCNWIVKKKISFSFSFILLKPTRVCPVGILRITQFHCHVDNVANDFENHHNPILWFLTLRICVSVAVTNNKHRSFKVICTNKSFFCSTLTTVTTITKTHLVKKSHNGWISTEYKGFNLIWIFTSHSQYSFMLDKGYVLLSEMDSCCHYSSSEINFWCCTTFFFCEQLRAKLQLL